MNKNIWIVIGIIAIVAAGGLYAAKNSRENAAMMQKDSENDAMLATQDKAMAEKEALEDKGVMMQIGTSTMDKGETMMKAGSYEAYSPDKVMLASGTHDVVLFFRASWCPTCRALDRDIKANLSKIPESLTILDVSYDNSTELKQKYGVTYQHTFVQVDKNGTLIKKWSGSATLSALVSEVK